MGLIPPSPTGYHSTIVNFKYLIVRMLYMSKVYNGLGRPIVKVFQGNGPWTSSIYTLHTPEGICRGLDSNDVVGILSSYPVKPVIEYQKGVSGGAKKHFRAAVSNMPLPTGYPNQ